MPVVFETPGLIDRRAFTVFGAHAKPNSASPIGQFGTGLKMAIAILVRNKIPVTVYIGSAPHVFYVKDEDFRGSNLATVRMKRATGLMARWQYELLPFTTHLANHWKLWQALRELESNTLDEGGSSYTTSTDPGPGDGLTRIVVDGAAFTEEYAKKDEIFLPGASREVSIGAETFDRQSQHVYWRGLRVYTPNKRTLFTWNLLSRQYLTEDRTLAHPFLAHDTMATHVATSEDETFVRRVLNAESAFLESTLPFQDLSAIKPSETFLRVSRECSNSAAAAYGAGWAPGGLSTLDWRQRLLLALQGRDDTATLAVINNHRGSLTALLRDSLAGEGLATGPSDDTPF